MNKILLKGRISSEVTLNKSDGGKAFAKFSIAVSRAFNREKTDFFPCVAFGARGEFIAKYFKKGQEILLAGEMQCEKWKDQDGAARRSFSVVVSEAEFCGSKRERGEDEAPADVNPAPPEPMFDEIESVLEESDLPF